MKEQDSVCSLQRWSAQSWFQSTTQRFLLKAHCSLWVTTGSWPGWPFVRSLVSSPDAAFSAHITVPVLGSTFALFCSLLIWWFEDPLHPQIQDQKELWLPLKIQNIP